MFNLDEYTTVRERIKLFWEKYPDGSIQTEILDWSDKPVSYTHLTLPTNREV